MEAQLSDVRPRRSQCPPVLRLPVLPAALGSSTSSVVFHNYLAVPRSCCLSTALTPLLSALPSHAPTKWKLQLLFLSKKPRSAWAGRWARVAVAAPRLSALPSHHACTPGLPLGAEFLFPTSCTVPRAPPSLPHIFHSLLWVPRLLEHLGICILKILDPLLRLLSDPSPTSPPSFSHSFQDFSAFPESSRVKPVGLVTSGSEKEHHIHKHNCKVASLQLVTPSTEERCIVG